MATYSTTSAPLPWMEPYLQDAMSRGMDIANRTYTPSPTQYVGPNPYLQTGWDATYQRAMQGSPVMNTANQQLQQTMQGGYLNNNPYLDQSIANAQGDLVKSWNQVQKPQWDMAMQRSGSFGNTGVAQSAGFGADTLQQNLGRIGQDMRNNAYQFERGNQMQAMGMAPAFANQDYQDAQMLNQVGMQRQMFDQQQANQNYNWWQEAQNFPVQNLGVYAQMLGLGSGGTTTQTQPDPSTANQVIGGALTGASLLDLLLGKP